MSAVAVLGLDLLGVFLATIVAGTSPQAAKIMFWIMVALWMVFMLTHSTKFLATINKTTTTKGALP